MVDKIALTVLLAIFSLISDPAKSDVTNWKTVGWWDIAAYSNSNGCSAAVSYDGGVNFFIGLGGRDRLLLDILISHRDWRSIEDGKEYEVIVKFGNETPWTLEMTGYAGENFFGLSLTIPADTKKAGLLVEEFMREVNMEWRYNGQSLGFLKLNGSRAAFKEVVNCTKSYRSATQSSGDPFSKNTGNDPFE